jgi:MFS family permease
MDDSRQLEPEPRRPPPEFDPDAVGASTEISVVPQPSTHAAPEAPLLGAGLFSPLRARDFRLLWAGEAISVLGTQVHMVALPWLTLQLTGSGLALGTVLMAGSIPRAAFMLAGGALTDRFSPRALMLGSNLARAFLVAIITVLVATQTIQLWQLYLIAFLYGIADAFFYPAFAAIVPAVLEEERLASGNALLHGTTQLAGLLGPAIGGVLVSAISMASAFGIDAASFVFATLMLFLMRSGRAAHHQDAHTMREEGKGLLHSIQEGIAYAWRDNVLRALLLIIALINLGFLGPFVVGSPMMARQMPEDELIRQALAWLTGHSERLSGIDPRAAALGIMFSAFGAGALLGTIIAGTLRRIPHRGMVVVGGTALFSFGAGLLGYAPSVWYAAAIIAPIGITAGFANVLLITWIQKGTEPKMLGRVMSLVMFNALGLLPFSYALAGALADVGTHVLFRVSALLLFVAFVTAASSKPVRQFD